MNRCVFIIPYFGKFNNYFQLFLNSCKPNNRFDWLIITDDHGDYAYPSNVKVIYSDFSNIKTKIQEKLDG